MAASAVPAAAGACFHLPASPARRRLSARALALASASGPTTAAAAAAAESQHTCAIDINQHHHPPPQSFHGYPHLQQSFPEEHRNAEES